MSQDKFGNTEKRKMPIEHTEEIIYVPIKRRKTAPKRNKKKKRKNQNNFANTVIISKENINVENNNNIGKENLEQTQQINENVTEKKITNVKNFEQNEIVNERNLEKTQSKNMKVIEFTNQRNLEQILPLNEKVTKKGIRNVKNIEPTESSSGDTFMREISGKEVIIIKFNSINGVSKEIRYNLNRGDVIEIRTGIEDASTSQTSGVANAGSSCGDSFRREMSGKPVIINKFNSSNDVLKEKHDLNRGDVIELRTGNKDASTSQTSGVKNAGSSCGDSFMKEISGKPVMINKFNSSNDVLKEKHDLNRGDVIEIRTGNKDASTSQTSDVKNAVEFESRRVKFKCFICSYLCDHMIKKKIGKSKHIVVCQCATQHLIQFNEKNKLNSITIKNSQ